jgi:molybdopterin synthase catalytic subunit
VKTFLVSDAPLSVEAVLGLVEDGGVGGVALFVGTVRDQNAGQPITLLEYHAYASMAEKEMQRVASEITAELPGTRLCVHHRTGQLRVGEIAVICAAAAAHRDAAFQGCRALIDRIKQRVPIWKREHGPAGPYWVGWESQNKTPDG